MPLAYCPHPYEETLKGLRYFIYDLKSWRAFYGSCWNFFQSSEGGLHLFMALWHAKPTIPFNFSGEKWILVQPKLLWVVDLIPKSCGLFKSSLLDGIIVGALMRLSMSDIFRVQLWSTWCHFLPEMAAKVPMNLEFEGRYLPNKIGLKKD